MLEGMEKKEQPRHGGNRKGARSPKQWEGRSDKEGGLEAGRMGGGSSETTGGKRRSRQSNGEKEAERWGTEMVSRRATEKCAGV